MRIQHHLRPSLPNFPDRLRIEDAGMRGDARIFRLLEPFRYYSSQGPIVAHRHFETDGASIPKIFHNIMGPFGIYFHAAVIHDLLYSK